MIVTLEMAKNFLRVDFDDDDELIQLLINSAELQIQQSVGKSFDSSCALAKVIALKIISINYNNRNNIVSKRSTIIPNFIKNDLAILKSFNDVTEKGDTNV